MVETGAERAQIHSNSLQIGKDLQSRWRTNDIYRCDGHRQCCMRGYQSESLYYQSRKDLNLSSDYNRDLYPPSLLFCQEEGRGRAAV